MTERPASPQPSAGERPEEDERSFPFFTRLRRLAPTPEQLERLAAIKFPCC